MCNQNNPDCVDPAEIAKYRENPDGLARMSPARFRNFAGMIATDTVYPLLREKLTPEAQKLFNMYDNLLTFAWDEGRTLNSLDDVQEVHDTIIKALALPAPVADW